MLGSWTELRHDTILYAKQSYTMFTRSLLPKPSLTHGFVEPYPEVYGRLKLMGEGLDSLLEKFKIEYLVKVKLKEFVQLLVQLEIIAEKEVNGKKVSEEEYELIWNIGELLSSIISFPKEVMEKISSQTDEQAAVVADVHTDINTKQVLQEATGLPSNIFVMIKNRNGKKILRGPVFSYYEFKHPMNDRLTDEDWKTMLETGDIPNRPEWIGSFFSE